ncbi:MAG: MutS-related protein [Candidatus Helarchaeota archaeon]
MTVAERGLLNISGIGERIADKLVEHFGGEQSAIDAIMNSTITEIASIRGIGMKKAMRIVSTFHESRMGVKKEDVLKTADISRIHSEILAILKNYAQTDYTRDKFSILYPLPSRFQEKIQERVDYFSEARPVVERVGELGKKIKVHLSKIKPLRNTVKKIRRKKAILTDNEQLYNNILEDEDISRYCDIQYIEKSSHEAMEILQESSKSHDLVFTIFESFSFNHDLINVIPLLEFQFHKILPEFGIDVFISNSKMIKHAYILVKIIHTLNESSTMKKFKQDLDLEVLEEIIDFLENVMEDGELSKDFNEEIFELRKCIDNFERIMSDLELWMNETITKKIEELEIKLDGNQILSILKAKGESMDGSFDIASFLPSDIADIMYSTIQQAQELLFKKLHFKEDEEISINSYFLDDGFSLPIEFNHEKLNELKNHLNKKYFVKEHFILCSYHEKISQYEKDLRKIIKTLLDFDEFFAVGNFAKDYDLKPPKLFQIGHGIAIKDGINLLLKKEELRDPTFQAVPINYGIGRTELFAEKTKNERIVVLSGANSGGKTCLLQTIAHVVLLAQMGFPVPASVSEIGLVDEIYFFSKSTGMVSAGAFETSLETFAQIISSKHPKLVLFDELEAMTEPGAATKIISCLLEIFHESTNITCCLVSHLAEQIMKNIGITVRIDGIEARGLKDGKLIVDRNPRYYYLAKSMPILIVEKLCTTRDITKKDFFMKIRNSLTR